MRAGRSGRVVRRTGPKGRYVRENKTNRSERSEARPSGRRRLCGAPAERSPSGRTRVSANKLVRLVFNALK